MKFFKKPEILTTILVLVLGLFCIKYHIAIISFLSGIIKVEPSKILAVKDAIFLIFISTCIYLTVKKLNKRVILSERRFQSLFYNNPLPTWICENKSLKFLEVNKAAIETYGYCKDEFLSMTVPDIKFAIETCKPGELENSSLFESGTLEMWRHKKKNGSEIIVEISFQEIVFNNLKCRLVTARDVTEIARAKEGQRKAEEESIQQKSFTSYVLENFPVDVALFDKDHRYVMVNKVAVKNDEVRNWLIGKTDFDYCRLKNRDTAMAEIRNVRFKKALAGENESWIDEHMENGERKFLLRKFYPYKEDGEIKFVLGYGMDITPIILAEKHKDDYIRQLEKMAFQTSHQVRQPICNMKSIFHILQQDKTTEPEKILLYSFVQISMDKLDEFTRHLASELHVYKSNLVSAVGPP